MKEENRWIEIQFLYFVINLNKTLENPKLENAYIEFLSAVNHLDAKTVLQLVDKMWSDMRIRPVRTEAIATALHFGIPRAKICRLLSLGNRQYEAATEGITTAYIREAVCTEDEITIMKKLLYTNKQLGGITIL